MNIKNIGEIVKTYVNRKTALYLAGAALVALPIIRTGINDLREYPQIDREMNLRSTVNTLYEHEDGLAKRLSEMNPPAETDSVRAKIWQAIKSSEKFRAAFYFGIEQDSTGNWKFINE